MATADADGGGEAQQRVKAPKQTAELTAEQLRKSKARLPGLVLSSH